MFRGVCVMLCVILLASPFLMAGISAKGEDYTWVGSWSTSPVKAGVKVGTIRLMDFLTNRTIRTCVKMTLGGDCVRIRLSNIYGEAPITISQVALARTSLSNDAEIIENTSVPLSFSGSGSVTVPAGEYIYSDPVKYEVTALEKLSVSYFVSSFTNITTAGFYGGTTYVSNGNQINSSSLSEPTMLQFNTGSISLHTIPFLTNIDVNAPDAYSVVIFGDSTVTNQSPYLLAEKFVLNDIENIGVLQQGIVGNRVLYSGEGVSAFSAIYGEAAIDRFEHDVISQAGVKKVFIKIGLNDILHPKTKSMADKAPFASVESIISGYEMLIKKARANGIQVYFFLRSSWKGYGRSVGLSQPDDLVWTMESQSMMDQLNSWIRSTPTIDGYINVDALNDTEDKYALRKEYTVDGAHLTDEGAKVLVDQIPMKFFDINSSGIAPIAELYKQGKGGKSYSSLPEFSSVATTIPNLTTAPQSSAAQGTGQTTAPLTTQEVSVNETQQGGVIINSQQGYVLDYTSQPDSIAQGSTAEKPPTSTKAKVAAVAFALICMGGVIGMSMYFSRKRNTE